MLTGLFGKVTGLFDNRFLLGLLMPCLAFTGGILALIATAYGWNATLSHWRRLSGGEQALLAVAALAAVTFAALMVGVQLPALTRFWEGYWRGPAGRHCAAAGSRLQRRRRRLLDPSDPHDDMRRYYEFPADPSKILPTRLGNALRAAESYPGDDERYGADAVFFWPRLYLVLPDQTRLALAQARAAMEQMLVVTTLLMTAAPAAVVIGLAGPLPLALWTSATVGCLLLALLAYRSAVGAAVTFGDLVRAAFDLHRRDLLTQLGLAPPETLDEERALWKAVSQQLYRRGADDPELLRFERPGPTPG
jgi:hypothetical protein